MNRLIDICTPTVLLFLIVTFGYFIGKIKIYNISLDLSAILIVAVLTGYLTSELNIPITGASFDNSMSLFSKFGTSLFISSIGLSTGLSSKENFRKNNILSFLIGSLMVMSGFVTINVIEHLDKTIDKSLLLGILCGSLTSTPGLSTVCEVEKVSSEFAVVGYGCTYLIGVVGIVVFSQIMTREKDGQNLFRNIKYSATISSANMQTLVFLGVSIILGNILGSINFFNYKFALGASGGILCFSILFGFILQKLPQKSTTSSDSLSTYRNLGLVMFFVGSGIPAGVKLNSPFELKWIAYGIILVFVPITLGYFFSYITKEKTINRVGIVAGGMTSTPAIGVLLRNKEASLDLSVYSSSYIGALITMIVLANIISNLLID